MSTQEKYLKTTNYDLFKFIDHNRPIHHAHIEHLKQSISEKNMLNIRPIEVNSNMEVLDGQHRLMAAKALQLPIYYRIVDNQDDIDIILMQTQKSWYNMDYFNSYYKRAYPEYVKMKHFMDKYKVSFKNCLSICIGSSDRILKDLREGKIVFDSEVLEKHIEKIRETVETIKTYNGTKNATYLDASKFWKALVKLFETEGFNQEKWIKNVIKQTGKFRPLAREVDYVNLVESIYNFHNAHSIRIER